MPIGAPKDLIDCRHFFLEPRHSKQRLYEALRAFFVENKPSKEVAKAFGYSIGSFRVACHHFRRDANPLFFLSPPKGPRSQPKKSAAHDLIIALRKRNYSVYEISEALKEKNHPLSATAVREVLKAEGFAPLPRRLDEERPQRPRPTLEPVADVRAFSLQPRAFTTRCGGLFLFLPHLVRLQFDLLAQAIHLPGSKMIPPQNALLSALGLKLWSIERKSHVMALVADEGLALFTGLPVIPKKSFLSEYSCRIDPKRTLALLSAWHDKVSPGENLWDGSSFNLDFHSVPFFGEDPLVERHYVAMRSRRQKSILCFLAQDAKGRAFCYSNANLRKGEEAEEIFRFISFWKQNHGENPKELVFDSRLTTYPNLARLDEMGIPFITLRRRSPALLKEVALLPRSAWKTIELDVPTRKYRFPRVYEQTIRLNGRDFRQVFIRRIAHGNCTRRPSQNRT